jgi:hypothetical protein
MSYNHGTLGAQTPNANVQTTLYTAPANTQAGAAVTVCNRNAAAVQVSIGRQPSGSGTIYWIVYQEPLDPAGTSSNRLELRALSLSPGDAIIVSANSGAVDFIADGHEDPFNANSLDV